MLIFLAAKSGFIKNVDEAADFQNCIICVEMLIAALGHLYAFPYKEYAGANIGGSRGFTASLAHALKLNDFYHDTVHQVSHSTCFIFLLLGFQEDYTSFHATPPALVTLSFSLLFWG